MPLHHGAGPKAARTCHAAGGCVYLLDHFEPERALAMIEKHRLTHWKTVPTMLNRVRGLPDKVLNRYDTSSLEAISVGSAPCAPGLKQWVMDHFGPLILHEGYGTSEAGMITVMRPQMMARKLGSCGRARRQTQIRIVDSSGAPVPAGMDGRILVRTPVTVQRYLGDPSDQASLLDEDGFYDTGDVGHLDSDDYLYITGRSKDMIIAGGVNIFPAEIEQIIGELPAVAEAAVIGIATPDMGEQVIGFGE